MGTEKPMAVRERLAAGPQDNYGGVAGGIRCSVEEMERGQGPWFVG